MTKVKQHPDKAFLNVISIELIAELEDKRKYYTRKRLDEICKAFLDVFQDFDPVDYAYFNNLIEKEIGYKDAD